MFLFMVLGIYFFICLFISLFVYLFLYLSIYFFIREFEQSLRLFLVLLAAAKKGNLQMVSFVAYVF